MKRLSSLALLALMAIPAMTGCGKGSKYVRPIVDNAVYEVTIPNRESPVTGVNVLNVPKTSIEVGYMSYMGIKLEIHYADEEVISIPFTEKLFPLDQLLTLKTPGKKYIDFLFKGQHINFDLTLVEAEVPVYHKVIFRDQNNLVLQEKLFSYLEPAVYSGRSIDSYLDGDYYYEFANEWDQDTDFVYCDFETHAVYNATDVRDYGKKYTTRMNLNHEQGTYAYNVFPIISSKDKDTNSPKYLYYIGEVRDVEIASSEAFYHKESDFDAAEMKLSSKDELDFNAKMIRMTQNVYNLGDQEQTARYPTVRLGDAHKLALDLTVENGKAKGFGDGRFKEMGYGGNLNYQRTDGRIISYESVLNQSIADDVYSMMEKEVSIPLYAKAKKSGYYRVSHVTTVDLVLEVTFDTSVSEVAKVSEAKLYPCPVYQKPKAILSYSPSGEFNETHQQAIDFNIDDLRAFFANN